MIGRARFHRRRDAQCLVDAAKVVVHDVKGNVEFVIFDLL
jgi:hypothetical protein